MKRGLFAVMVLLLAATSAQAVTAMYAEISYPTSTTWRLWIQECDWTGNPVGLTPSGYGIAGFAIDVEGVLTATKMTPLAQWVLDDEMTPVGQVGFPTGPGVATVTDGVAQCFAAQDTTIPEVLIYGFGVTAGTYTPPASWSGAYSWDAPGPPGSDHPGVLVFGGKRPADGIVSIVWGERAKCNFFTSSTGIGTDTFVVCPEPVSLGLLALGALAQRRRRE